MKEEHTSAAVQRYLDEWPTRAGDSLAEAAKALASRRRRYYKRGREQGPGIENP
jgi:hypothetical protein